MCGLVGVIGDLWLREKKVFDFLLKLDIVRGPHSTGVARIKPDGEAELIKGVGTTWHLIHDKPNEYYNTDQPKGIIEGNFKALMGHNRWATVGAVNEENAHPFTQGSITGAHNGTLDQYALNYRLEDSEKFGTDSECIMHNINIFGAEKTIGKMSGAWALTWYDRDEDTFNIIRNKERPLHFAWDKSGRSFFYASEDWMLAAAFERYDVEVENIWSLPSDTLYKFDMSTPITKFGQDRRTKTEMKGWTPPKYVHTPNHTNYGSNVSPFPRARNYSDRELALEMEKKIGSFVDFCVSSLRRDENNQEYVSGYVWNKPDVEIRVYETNRNSDLYMMLDDANIDEYYGKVKKVKTTARGVYLTLEHDSIGHIEWTADSRIDVTKIATVLDDTIPFDDADVEDGDDFIVGFGEQEVTELEYYRQVEHGCAWCSIVPPVEDCHDLKWMDRQTFLCADCCDDQYVAAEVLTK